MEDVLQHYGVLGMKWGIRRYQNKDGSYTSTGRKRHRLDDSSEAAKKQNAEIADYFSKNHTQTQDGSWAPRGKMGGMQNSEKREMRKAIRDTKKERKQALKNISQLSDEELEARLKRAQKEQQLKQYSRDITPAKSFVQNTMEQIGSKAIAAAVVGTVVYAGKKALGSGQVSLYGNNFDFKDVMNEVLDRFGK